MALALNKLVIAMYAGDRSCERVDGSRGRIVSRISKGRVRRGKEGWQFQTVA